MFCKPILPYVLSKFMHEGHMQNSKLMIQLSIVSFNLAINFCMFLQADQTVCPTMVSTPRTKTQALTQISIIQSQKTAQNRDRKKTKYGLKDSYNPVFRLPVDLYT